MNYTTHKKIQKPISIEKYNIGVFNTNMDIIDSELNKHDIKDNALEKSINDEVTRAKKAETENISKHNTSTTSHTDIRDLITGLTNRLNALADSDDTTLDQLSEIVAYIKNNKSLIDSVTTSKVNVSDIVDSLTSTATNKPLSAKQGEVLKGLIDTLESALNTHISDSSIHTTTTERTNWNDANNKKHTHSNKSIIDKITQVLLDNWSAAYTHISDTVKHITSAERTKWNTAEKNAIISIKKNGTALSIDSDRSVNITTPTKVSELSNDKGFITASDVDTSQNHTHTNKSVLDATTASYTTTEKSKLSGIATGAEVNVQSDWNVTDTNSDAYIKNKPGSLPANGGIANYLNANIIPANANLNSYTTPGFYYCPANATVATLSNCPTTNAFFMIVGKHAGVYQEVVEYMTGNHRIYNRNFYNNIWGSWCRVYTTMDAPTQYTHPTTAGNKHIPSGGSSGQILKWSANGTAVWATISTGGTQVVYQSAEPTSNLSSGMIWIG